MASEAHKAPRAGGVPAEVLEEEARLTRVLAAIEQRRRAAATPGPNYAADLVMLRDSLEDERLEEDRASIVEQMHRLSRLAAHRARAGGAALVDPLSPYFGHMRLEDEDGGQRDVLIGKQTFITEDITIVDWRHAPISRVFYQSTEGDEFEIEIAGRKLGGRVLVRRTLTIQQGRLHRVSGRDGTWVLGHEGWREAVADRPVLRGGAGVAPRPDRTRPVLGVRGDVPTLAGSRRDRFDKHLPEIASLLDPDQFELITQPDSGVVAIQGAAGSGKTTVALHRVAFLAFRDPERFAAQRLQIVVGTRALASYISHVLPALGVEGVPVTTWESWAHTQRRRHFPKLPDRYADDTPAVVTRLKLHPALLPMLAEAAKAHAGSHPAAVFGDIFTRRGWLGDGFARHAPGAFTEAELDRVHRWCTRQHFVRVDGAGATEDELPQLDVEDDAILLYMYQLLAGALRVGKKRLSYRHLVIDEVQDLSPIELHVLLQTAQRDAPVTLAGDVAQRIHEEGGFQRWEDVLRMLQLEHVQVSSLQVSYRSTAEIMSAAMAVLGPLAPAELPRASRHGAPVELLRFGGPGEALTFLVDALRALLEDEPAASAAVLTRHPEQANEVWEVLARADLPGLRRVDDQDFSFAPGVDVTDIRQTKGLEFDYVVLLDIDSRNFPVDPASRHLLHVGITRAAHQCWLTSVGTPSRLLPEWLEAHRVA